ncbi:predicted protein [Nematostella vectensis]|uniref:CBM21 domain-containing protein n=1 Tax=Nematostella vectensis TaxID=45351 RepID=A7RJS3_NEMVE|nr:predicted protein [Nematostella vectensis]|eukprot:XP_001640485.1 predicted protein [Nematostella vectensis]
MAEPISCLKRKISGEETGIFDPQSVRNANNTNDKSVTFADVLGEQLVSVKHITPTSSYEDVKKAFIRRKINSRKIYEVKDENNNIIPGRYPGANGLSKTYLKCCFPQPASSPDFLERMRTQMVCLENAYMGDSSNLELIGLIRVRNISYEKEVFARYSIDHWIHFQDCMAAHLLQTNEGKFDKFIFKLVLPKCFYVGGTVEFAVCFKKNGQEYWDNNRGNNFTVKCCE